MHIYISKLAQLNIILFQLNETIFLIKFTDNLNWTKDVCITLSNFIKLHKSILYFVDCVFIIKIIIIFIN